MIDSVAGAKNLLCMGSSLQILSTASFYQTRWGSDLVFATAARAAEECHIRRDFRELEILGNTMIEICREPYRAVGHYYLALVARLGSGNLAGSEQMLVECSPGLPAQYMSRALMAHAHSAFLVGDRAGAARLLMEAWRAGVKNDFCDPKTVVSAARFLNYWRAADGGARKALENLYDMLPMVRTAARIYPFLYYDHLDTMAYVAGMLERWQEAKQMSDVVMTAPMAAAYPNWREHHAMFTRNAGRHRSTVLIMGAPQSGARAPDQPEVDQPRASVVNIAEWKSSRAPANTAPLPGSVRDKKRRFLNWVTQRGISEEEALAIFTAAPLSDKGAAVIDLVLRCEELIDPALTILLASRPGR